MFSIRSVSVKPKSLLRPWRILSPSSKNVCRFNRWSVFSTSLAIVDLPEPERPVNHKIFGFWFLSAACASRVMSVACQWTFCARRKEKCSMPAATVALVILSIRINPPKTWLLAYGSNTIGLSVNISATPMAFSSNVFAARCSILFTLTVYLGDCTLADTVCVPSFSQ